MPIQTVKEAVKELFYWQYGSNPTNFTANLFTLMQQADMVNRARLASAFPLEDEALNLWMEAPDPKDFFKQWGFEVHYPTSVSVRAFRAPGAPPAPLEEV